MADEAQRAKRRTSPAGVAFAVLVAAAALFAVLNLGVFPSHLRRANRGDARPGPAAWSSHTYSVRPATEPGCMHARDAARKHTAER